MQAAIWKIERKEITMLSMNEPRITLSPERMHQLEQLAKLTGRSPDFLADEALEQYLDVQAWQRKVMQEAIDYADSPDAKFASHEEVGEWIKSLGTDNPKDLPECKHRRV